MNNFYDEVRSKAFSAFRALAREYPPFDDANMLVGSADTQVSLTRSKITKSIDTEWIDRIEEAIPALDIIIRNPSVAIEDVDEVLPVELSKHITEKSIKHLAQHTNFILDIKDGEVVPLKILNVFHEETYLTYENKFVNTLLSRLSAFVDKRMRALNSSGGVEMDYKFDYSTEFEHILENEGGRNSARINLRIELTSPLGREMSESDYEVNERYISSLNRIKRINMALISYRSSAFCQKLGNNYVRPPVIRTNAILKNKNLKECLALWEYIEGYDKVGYSFVGDKYYELPSSDFVGGMYSSIALQYLTFYSGLAGELDNNRLISEKHLFETMPEFDDEIQNEELDDYQVYDSEYKKTVPVSRLMNNRKKLSEDEKKIRTAILVALKADEIINEQILREEAERRRIAREKRLIEEAEARRLREEEEARRLAEQEAAKLAAELAKRRVEIRYRRSFLSRYIQAEPYIQDYYTEIKNALLSYKGVKSRTSWSKESFKCGRKHIAKIDVKGKALCLYLALDPSLLEGTKYRFTLANGDCQVLLKIKSDRKKKYALELIEMLMSEIGLLRRERENENYRLPYEENEVLIERGLIKVILPKGEVLDENSVGVKADLSGIGAKRSEKENEKSADLAETVEAIRDSLVEVEDENKSSLDFAAEVERELEKTLESEAEMEREAEILSEHEMETVVGAEALLESDVAEEHEPETVPAIPILLENYSENALAEDITIYEDEKRFEGKINDIIESSINTGINVDLTTPAAPLLTRGGRGPGIYFVFLGSVGAENADIVVPYTRSQYLAMPRKKKKRVLTNVKALLRYAATSRLIDALTALGSDNARIAERIERLSRRLIEQRKNLPTEKIWAEAVKRIAK